MRKIEEEKFRDEVLSIFRNLKHEIPCMGAEPTIPLFGEDNAMMARLSVITRRLLDQPADLQMIQEWRLQYASAFPTESTPSYVKKWARAFVDTDTIAWFIETLDGIRVGMFSLGDFDFKARSCYTANAIRVRRDVKLPRVMTLTYRAVVEWAFTLGVREVFSLLFSDNRASILMNLQSGMEIIKKIPLHRVSLEEGGTRLVPLPDDFKGEAERYFFLTYRKSPYEDL